MAFMPRDNFRRKTLNFLVDSFSFYAPFSEFNSLTLPQILMPFRGSCQSRSWVLRSCEIWSRFVQPPRSNGALDIYRSRTGLPKYAAGGHDARLYFTS